MRTTIALSASDEGDFSKVGDMIDISKGGLSFRHPTSEEVPFGLVKLTLIGHTQPTVFINEIPCKIVYEFALPAQSGSSEHPSKSYRMGVRFEGLSEHQRSQLDHFIQIHGTPDDKLMD